MRNFALDKHYVYSIPDVVRERLNDSALMKAQGFSLPTCAFHSFRIVLGVACRITYSLTYCSNHINLSLDMPFQTASAGCVCVPYGKYVIRN